MAIDFHSHSSQLQNLLESQTEFVIATLVDARGSAPQVIGAKAFITLAGLHHGTIGGGKIEARAIRHAQELLQAANCRPCELVTWNLQTDIGMTCGGEVRLVFEVANRLTWKIAVFGAGHIAQSLIPLLLQLPCSVTCLDSRRPWLDKLPTHPRLTLVCSETLDERVQELDPGSFFVLMTQGHAVDLPILARILTKTQSRYVGVIGSLQKARILRRDLESQGIAPHRCDAFFCPLGLPLGNNTPPEIAISVVAQLIQERDRLGIIVQKTKSF